MAAVLWNDLVIPPRLEMLPVVQAAGAAMAEMCGFGAQQRNQIQLSIEEVLTTLLQYAFSEEQEGEIRIRFERTAAELRIVVAEKGMPFDPDRIPEFEPDGASLSTIDPAGLSVFLIKSSVDSYRIENRGAEGTRVTLRKNLPQRDITHYDAPDRPAGPVVLSGELAEVRPMRPDEAIEVSRLVWRSYGYSYVNEDMYFPERIVARHEEGVLQSLVAKNIDGQIVGHVALMRDDPRSQLSEWGMAVVHPACRGGGIMKRLVAALGPLAAERKDRATYAHAVTNHPYTQKTCLSFGYEPVALLLGYAPATLSFRRISDELRQRESTFIFMLSHRLTDQARLEAPPRHQPLLTSLLKSVGVNVRWGAGPHREPVGQPTRIEARVVSALNVGLLLVHQVGGDLASALSRAHRRLCNERVDVVYLHLDLGGQGCTEAWEHAERIGYFFAGVHPLNPWEQTVVLQFLNNYPVDFHAICAFGSGAEALIAYVKEESLRAERRLQEGQ